MPGDDGFLRLHTQAEVAEERGRLEVLQTELEQRAAECEEQARKCDEQARKLQELQDGLGPQVGDG